MKASIAKGLRSVLEGRSGFAATIQTFLVKFFVLVLGVATGAITARFLGAEGRGEQAAMLLWPQLLAFTLALGLPKSLLYNLKKYPEQRSQLFSMALLMVTGAGCIAAAIGIIFMPTWLSQYSTQTIHHAQWLMLTAPLALLSVTYLSAFEVENDFTTANQLRYLVPITTLVTLCILILLKAITPWSVVLAYSLPGIPINIWMMLRLWKRYQPRFNKLRQSFRLLVSYGLRSFTIELVSGLSLQIGQALAVSSLSASAMGLYTIALSLSRMLMVFDDAINTVLLPKATARPLAEVIALAGRSARISALLSTLCALPVIILSPFFLQLLYGVEFLPAVPVVRVLLIEVILAGATWILGQTFMAVGRPGVVTITQGVGLLFTVPLMIFLLPKYQIMGAGLALLGSTIARLVFVLISYPLFLKVPPPNLIIMLDDLRFIKEKLFPNLSS